MKSLGYYAKDKNGNLFQFEWTKDDVLLIDGISVSAEDYEILELFHSTADTIESPKTVDDLNELALPMIAELVEEGIIQDCTDTDDSTEFDVQDIIVNKLAEKFGIVID